MVLGNNTTHAPTMTMNCDLCGRGTARKTLTPTWWPYEVCERANCREAARDALKAINDSRDAHADLVGSIAERHEAQMMPIGWRDDAMAEIDVFEEREWWANGIAKQV